MQRSQPHSAITPASDCRGIAVQKSRNPFLYTVYDEVPIFSEATRRLVWHDEKSILVTIKARHTFIMKEVDQPPDNSFGGPSKNNQTENTTNVMILINGNS